MVTKMGRPTEDPKTVQTRIRMIEKVHAEINK